MEMTEILERMCAIVERHADKPRTQTAVPGLVLYQMETSVHPIHALYNPRVCIILRGGKTVTLGEQSFYADPSTFLLVTVDLPVTSRVVKEAAGQSHLALTLDLDRAILADVLQRVPPRQVSANSPAGVVPSTLTGPLLAPIERLLGLLDTPDEIEFVRPLIVQEIYYRMVCSDLASVLGQFALGGSHLWQIGKATRWIRENYKGVMSIEDLADMAGMSVTSFHRHFKAVTLMTPVQYRTQVRLQEARRLLISQRTAAGAAGIAVGYDSQSQFTRDYKRMFGAPPASDIARLVGVA
jgi:AraC-like DNA-binding protein